MDVLTAFIFLVISLKILIIDFKFYDYVKQNITYTDIYKQEYIDPMNVSFEFPEKKRNLILIILESMETTFFAKEYGGAFDEDLIPELRKLAKENLNFSDTSSLGGTLQIEGTNWTMSAIVGMTLGIPMVTTIDGFDVDWNGFDRYVNFKKTRFLPGIIGLTDILGNAGYDQRFLIGSDKKIRRNRFIFFYTWKCCY
jgi:phosphoglycerol transferase